jgi:hypothetical protein
MGSSTVPNQGQPVSLRPFVVRTVSCLQTSLNLALFRRRWLAEMTDIATSQNLLHKLALHGGGRGSACNASTPSPPELNATLMNMSPNAAHKVSESNASVLSLLLA